MCEKDFGNSHGLYIVEVISQRLYLNGKVAFSCTQDGIQFVGAEGKGYYLALAALLEVLKKFNIYLVDVNSISVDKVEVNRENFNIILKSEASIMEDGKEISLYTFNPGHLTMVGNFLVKFEDIPYWKVHIQETLKDEKKKSYLYKSRITFQAKSGPIMVIKQWNN